jgi:RNA polymerase sigma factor (sigma-70 family)
MMVSYMKLPVVLASSADPSTTLLVQRCLQGDAGAWASLIARYSRLVHAVPVRNGLSPVEVDDVGQEVFLALAQNLHALDDPERLPAWLVTTARRVSWRVIQRRRLEQPLDEDIDENDDERSAAKPLVSSLPTPEELIAGWNRQEALQAAMDKLGHRCRDMLTLIFLDPDEPSYDDIGEQLGMPKGSIGPTRNRCLQQMRTLLESFGTHDSE